MKTKLSFLGKYLLGVMAVVLIFTVTLCSCNKLSHRFNSDYGETNDSVLVAQYINEITNPQFINPTEVMKYRCLQLENKEIDSLITSLPENILMNVATVLINKRGVATKSQIVDEYRANKSIYENLPDAKNPDKSTPVTPTAQKEDVPVTTVDDTREEKSTTYNSRDTIIDGKRCTIQTKIIEYE